MGTTTICSTQQNRNELEPRTCPADLFRGEIGDEGDRVCGASFDAPSGLGRGAAALKLAEELAREAGGTAEVTRELEALILGMRARQRAAWMSRRRRHLRLLPSAF